MDFMNKEKAFNIVYAYNFRIYIGLFFSSIFITISGFINITRFPYFLLDFFGAITLVYTLINYVIETRNLSYFKESNLKKDKTYYYFKVISIPIYLIYILLINTIYHYFSGTSFNPLVLFINIFIFIILLVIDFTYIVNNVDKAKVKFIINDKITYFNEEAKRKDIIISYTLMKLVPFFFALTSATLILYGINQTTLLEKNLDILLLCLAIFLSVTTIVLIILSLTYAHYLKVYKLKKILNLGLEILLSLTYFVLVYLIFLNSITMFESIFHLLIYVLISLISYLSIVYAFIFILGTNEIIEFSRVISKKMIINKEINPK